jgi:DNA-binding MarR family transcriptional regulator
LRADISLLFNFFVTGQRIRRVLGEAMAPSGLKPDEYAVYSLLVEKAPLTATQMADFLGMPLSTVLDYLKAMRDAGHLSRVRHPDDARAVQLRLSARGMTAFRRAHGYFELVHRQFVGSLSVPMDRVKLALEAMDDAAQALDRDRAERPRARLGG